MLGVSHKSLPVCFKEQNVLAFMLGEAQQIEMSAEYHSGFVTVKELHF